MNTIKNIPFFVYGTLRYPRTLDMLQVSPIYINEAKLTGFVKDGLNIVEQEGGEVVGNYFQVNESELNILDSYEHYPSLYTRFLVNVEVNGEMKRAYVYQLN